MNKMKVLSILSEKSTVDVDSLSRELGLSGHTVQAMIDLMAHQGYLEEIECGSGCSMCPMSCGSLTSSKIKMYNLTEKGMECIKVLKRCKDV